MTQDRREFTPRSYSSRSGVTATGAGPDGRSALAARVLVVSAAVVAVPAEGQEVLQLRGDLVGARELAVAVGQRRTQMGVLHIRVVPLLQRADQLGELGVARDLLVDVGDELAVLLAQA